MGYEQFYDGAKYPLEPKSDSLYTGASIPAEKLGGATSIQTANQVTEVSNILNSGMKAVEVATINPDVFDMIPQQHLKEIDRLTKLNNIDVSLHAPMIEPSGFTQQGWNEDNRREIERQFKDVIFRAHELSPNKPLPVTIHSTAVPGTETMPIELIKDITPEEKELYGKDGRIPTKTIAVNTQTGEMTPLIREIEYYPETGKRIKTPEERLDIVNNSHWINKVTNLAFYKKEADEILVPAAGNLLPVLGELKEKNVTEDRIKEITTEHQGDLEKLNRANLFLENVQSSFRTLYDEAYKTGDDNTKKILDEISDKWKRGRKEIAERGNAIEAPIITSRLLDESLDLLREIELRGAVPKVFRPIEEFATEKASETFSNVAVEAYKKFGDKAPFISIENPPYGTAISTGQELKNLIKETRDKIQEKLSREGYSESAAQKAAEQMVGATWDTSHISMIRKQGYKKEDLIKEAEIIAPYVKHVHLNDNLGYTHTDLPPGMGDVPFKEIIDKLKKAGFKGKNIFEGGGFFQHFKISPHGMVLESMGSPIYSAVAQPTWTHTYGTMGNYASGGAIYPEQHFQMYGAGFSGLPTELGGQISGRQSRFSGTPMN